MRGGERGGERTYPLYSLPTPTFTLPKKDRASWGCESFLVNVVGVIRPLTDPLLHS